MKFPKAFWIIAGMLFGAASVAIHYEVKVVMHQRTTAAQQQAPFQFRAPARD